MKLNSPDVLGADFQLEPGYIHILVQLPVDCIHDLPYEVWTTEWFEEFHNQMLTPEQLPPVSELKSFIQSELPHRLQLFLALQKISLLLESLAACTSTSVVFLRRSIGTIQLDQYSVAKIIENPEKFDLMVKHLYRVRSIKTTSFSKMDAPRYQVIKHKGNITEWFLIDFMNAAPSLQYEGYELLVDSDHAPELNRLHTFAVDMSSYNNMRSKYLRSMVSFMSTNIISTSTVWRYWEREVKQTMHRRYFQAMNSSEQIDAQIDCPLHARLDLSNDEEEKSNSLLIALLYGTLLRIALGNV
ncbi:hypothetical protein THRCLA_20310 [Thraustotheca clavata]|uniref:Crinkler (CRN) family protein n=1 Tax=Thraustotheca clavata TaxID=74557 RepID=A0A1W0A8Q1_9STRA|nr:hypothetical protein THRCLA_20310 [Thraustotheca clavata]